jgi:REP element-mobilizing transposase RayT
LANTFTQIYVHIVFSVKHRASLISSVWREELHKYITGIIQNKRHKVLAINSMPDHIHIFVSMSPEEGLSALVREIKACSSRWINAHKPKVGKFEWQEGYGAFSYSHSQRANVIEYVRKQQEHHRKKTFREEYAAFLRIFNVPHDPRYVFDLKD